MSQENATVKSVVAYDMIRDLIIAGDLLPGTRLVLSELEEKLGVGRGPIREALLQLGKSGLVQNLPYKGAVVTPPPTLKEMETLYQMRVTVEVLMAVEAMHKVTELDIERLAQILANMRQHQDELSFFQEDRAFHTTLYAIAAMYHLQIIVDRMMDHVEVFFNRYSYEPADTSVIIAQHADILQAISDQDEAKLRSTMEANILIGVNLIQKEMLRFRYKNR